MKTLVLFLTLLLSLMLGLLSPVGAEQTPQDTTCNQGSGLAWNISSDTDLKEFNLYMDEQPITEDSPRKLLVVIPYSPASVVDGVIQENLSVDFTDGPKYFRVTSVDNSGQESAYSNQTGCLYDRIPDAPTNVTIQLRFR